MAAGYAPITPGWPDDPETVAEAREHPEVFAGKSDAAYKQQLTNPGTTEFAEIPGRGHALTIDNGWLEVANTSLAFVQRFAER